MVDVGFKFDTKNYGKAEVIAYNSCKEILVRFENTGFELFTTSEQVALGSVKDKMAKTVCGVGFIGGGKHLATSMDRKPYMVWRSMLQRCYMPSERQLSYKGCSVCENWHNFQNFAEWFFVNYKEGYELDKDIRVKGNKVYSPDTCMFVTKAENLSEKSISVVMMNGISGEVFEYRSLHDASNGTGVSIASISRLRRSRKNKCTSDGWFVI